MRRKNRSALVALASVVYAATSGTIFGGIVVTNFFSFGVTNGSAPQSALVLASDGNLYGTTDFGGTNGGNGTVFRLAPDGTVTSLYSFTGGNDGGNPDVSLIQGSDGSLYGATFNGGKRFSGLLYQISTNGELTPLHYFTGGTDGGRFVSSLVQGSDGNFYGTTVTGGTYTNGTVFKLSPSGDFTNLYSFTGGKDGGNPKGALVFGPDGKLYGTTEGGGTNGIGTVFRISTNGSLTSLHSFAGKSDGAYPTAALVLGSDTNFYGTTYSGGASNVGMVFKISTNGAFTGLHSFKGGNGGAYVSGGLTQGSDGNLYGATENAGANVPGTVFAISSNGVFNTIYSFTAATNGGSGEAPPVLGSDGSLYGTALSGSTNNGPGMIYRVSLPPHISAQPSYVSVWSGGSVSLPVSVSGSLPLSYRWQTNSVNLADAGELSGSATSNLMINPVSAAENAIYTVIVTNTFGSVTSAPIYLSVAVLSLSQTNQITYGFNFQSAGLSYLHQDNVFPFATVYSYGEGSAALDGTAVFTITGIALNGTAVNWSGPIGSLRNVLFDAGDYNVSIQFTPDGFPATNLETTLSVQTAELDATVPYINRPYGQPNPANQLVGYLSGLVGSDNIVLGVSCDASPAVPPGAYPINVTFQDSQNRLPNYHVVYAVGPLYVNPPDISYAPPPANDKFANRITLSGPNPIAAGNNFGATTEPSEPDPSGEVFGVTHSAWWSWTAPTNGLIRINADQSDFETFINVYTGSSLPALICVASNLPAITNLSGLSNQVSFVATAGTTYQIGISGFAEGNINFDIEPVTVGVSGLNSTVQPDQTTAFNFTANIGNAGVAPVGPLRVRLVGRAGYSYQAAFVSNPDLSLLPPDVDLGAFLLTNPASVAPGANATLQISGTCPAPVYPQSNFGYGWGVFAILEQQVGTNWFQLDKDFVLYGVWPTIGGFDGPGGGVIRLNPGANGGPPLYLSVQLHGPATVNAGSSAGYYATAQFISGTNSVAVNFTNSLWGASQFSISSGGVFQSGKVVTNTPVNVFCYFTYNGSQYTNQAPILVLKQPLTSFVTAAIGTNQTFGFSLNDLPGSKFVIEASTNITQTNGWTALSTNTTDTNGVLTITDPTSTNRPQKFYRARRTN